MNGATSEQKNSFFEMQEAVGSIESVAKIFSNDFNTQT